MKKTRILLLAFAAILTVAMVSCSKDDNGNNSSSVGNNDGDNSVVGGYTTAEWVDLGLPSGLLWNSCNLGATSPEKYGNYYAWGEIVPKEVYDWNTYRYCTVNSEGNLQTLTKYNTSSNHGTVDNLITLQAADDAATRVKVNLEEYLEKGIIK